ncbi:hypothetical protein CH373_10060 [Leptospira perolatii]|uniref:AlgX/AlgJ SGNH hydrolase-like domain-containing protein n=1 Tax=Leptospira perolatii TaxID=2023191 RepID=A0A2M9ZMQ1_9LEPT|nr:GDSL family lipase [Leptospira perolatii]PJZ70118.1 hypothetical protein CH360_07805 [Leptospira perolatii]PJZ73307.1 hypothetical protein CH373_10060 [Leptospira perolatii]
MNFFWRNWKTASNSLNFSKLLIRMVLGTILFFLIAESILRLSYFESIRFRLSDKEIHCVDPSSWIILCPNRSLTMTHPQKKVTYKITTNEKGERISANPITSRGDAYQSEIWVTGDSVAMGYLVSDEETLPWQLNLIFRKEKKDVFAMNLGVDARGAEGLLHQLQAKWKAPDKPREIYWIYHISDLPDAIREEKLISSVRYRILVKSSFYLSRYSSVFNGFRILSEKWKLSNEENRILPSQNSNQEGDDRGDRLPDTHPHFLALRKLFEFVKKEKIPFTIVLLPEPNASYEPVFEAPLLVKVRSIAKENSIRTLDLQPAFRKLWSKGHPAIFIPLDGHPNPFMYSTIAYLIYEDMRIRLDSQN